MGWPGVQVGIGLLGPNRPSGASMGLSTPAALLGLPMGMVLHPLYGLSPDQAREARGGETTGSHGRR